MNFPDPQFYLSQPPAVVDRGPWLATSTGGMWSILSPHPDDVDIRNIAAGLSRECRYAGQLKDDADFLAVAEHSAIMAVYAVETGIAKTLEDALAILLHDASEAFFGDMPTPVKALLPDFRLIEDHAQNVIMMGFGLVPGNVGITKAGIKSLDSRICIDERAVGLEDPARTIGLNAIWERDPEAKGLERKVRCLSSREARVDFLETFVWLCETLPSSTPAADLIAVQLEHAVSALVSMGERSPEISPAW